METIFVTVSDNFWILMLLVIPINAVIYRLRGRKLIGQNPELRDGYNKIASYFGVVGTIPFIFMSYELHTNGFGGMNFFLKWDGASVAMIGGSISLVLIEAALFYWIFFRNGAAILVRHPGFIQAPSKTLEEGLNNEKVYKGLVLIIIFSQVVFSLMEPSVDFSLFDQVFER